MPETSFIAWAKACAGSVDGGQGAKCPSGSLGVRKKLDTLTRASVKDRPPYLTDLKRDLAKTIEGEVRFDQGSIGLYATDSSNFREIPRGVVIPKTVGLEALDNQLFENEQLEHRDVEALAMLPRP
jgi:hypothetical protein